MFDASFFQTGDGRVTGAHQLVAFRHEPIENEAKSQAAGRPIFDAVEMVRIITPGAHDEIDKIATDVERSRFRDEYARFQAGPQHRVAGTPLGQWPALTRTHIAEMMAIEIFTVEQLAGASADLRHRIGATADELVARAAAFLAQARDNSTAERLAAENLRLQARNAELETNFRLLAAQVERLMEERTDASHGT